MHARFLFLAMALFPGILFASGRPPRLDGPQGSITETQPTFSWQAVEHATGYRLWVVNNNGVKLSEVVSSRDHCQGEQCSYPTVTAFEPGPYLWLVRSRVPGARDLWSSPKRFTVDGDPIMPPQVELIAPAGAIDTTTPTFKWHPAGKDVEYELTVRGNLPRTFFREVFPSSAICDDQMCATPPSITRLQLGDGKYRWHVRTKRSFRRGPSSDDLHFEVKTLPEPPSRPVAIAPSGRSSEASPTFVWRAAQRASGYEITLRGSGSVETLDKVAADATTCREAICRFASPTLELPAGRYSWSVTATNASGPSRPSRRLGFRIGDFLPTPDPLEPMGPTTTTPLFSWTAVSGARVYVVQVTNDDKRSILRRFKAEDVCRDETCETRLDTPLAKGHYTWRVSARGSKPHGNPSRWVELDVVKDPGTPPKIPTLVAPSGVVETKTPTFVWQHVETATRYELTVKDAFDPVLYTITLDAAKANCGDTCTLTPDDPLDNGEYGFTVRAINEFGAGEPANFKKFTVSIGGGVPPQSPRLIAPSGTVTTTTPDFRWQPVDDATSYHLTIESRAGQRRATYDYDGPAVCAAECAVRPEDPLSNGEYVYAVTARNAVGDSAPANSDFVVEVETTPPPATPLAPFGTTSETSPEFRWSFVSEAVSYTLSVRADESPFAFDQTYAPAQARCANECAVTPSLDLSDGGYTFTVETRAASGAVAESDTARFDVSAAASSITITSHVDGENVEDNGLVVSGTAGAGTAGLSAALDIDGTPTMAERSIAISPNDGWSVLIHPSELTPGAGTLRLIATDGAGGTSSLTLNLTVTAFDAKGANLLARATFGATPALLAELRANGTDAFQDRLLSPTPDPAFDSQVQSLPKTSEDELQEYALFHVLHNPNPLQEVLAQFWDNHFSTYINAHDMPEWELAEHDAFRLNAMGRYRDMLELSAKSPAMLHYLDGVSNIAAEPNENYPRELLELYAMGVDGGYTQDDVEALARILTGWSETGGVFVFNSSDHDFDEKTFLGRSFPAGVGLAEGERVLDILSEHRSTAEFICTKLAQVFVSDEPSAGLVSGCADVFQAEHLNGNARQIRDVVQYLLDSPDFVHLAGYRDKVKTPLELLAGTVRLLDATVEDLSDLERDLANDLDMKLFNNSPPDGFPEVADEWVDTGRLLSRVRFVNEVARETRERDTFVDIRAYFVDRGLETAEGIVGFLFDIALANDFTNVEMNVAFDTLSLENTSPFDINAPDAEDRLRRLVATVLSFPGFQHQ